MNNERNTKRCWVQLFTWTTPPTQQRSLGISRPIPETPKPSEQLDN